MNTASSQFNALSTITSASSTSPSFKHSAIKPSAGSQTPAGSHWFVTTANSTATSSPILNASVTPKRGVKNKKSANSGGTGIGGTRGPTNKRRCVSNACIACRKRKSKCDGNSPSCAACASVYGTECVYDPSSDHRRKGVYKKDIDNLKTRNSTLQTLVQAILDYPEDQVASLVHAIRSSDNLEEVAEAIAERGKNGLDSVIVDTGGDDAGKPEDGSKAAGLWQFWSTINQEKSESLLDNDRPVTPFGTEATFESELSHRMSQLRVDAESGQVRFIGGTSNLILLPSHIEREKEELDERSRASSPTGYSLPQSLRDPYESSRERNPVLSWTTVINEARVIQHLVNMYFAWHYPYFTTLSRDLFYRDYYAGYNSAKNNSIVSPHTFSSPSPPFYNSSTSPSPPIGQVSRSNYCTPLLVNAILALGCHFTSHPLARADPVNSNTVGDHFFKECKRLLLENDEHAIPRLATVQALALMSVREAGCAREDKGWSYSGMSFRMGIEMGLHLDFDKSREEGKRPKSAMNDEEIDARRVTFWGCYLFDKCWSNYMGRMPQLHSSIITVPRFMIIPSEDAANWCPYTDVGESFTSSQPARTRAVALQISELCEISSDILMGFYNPNPNTQKNKTTGSTNSLRAGQEAKAEIRQLGDLWNRLEDWKRKLPKELEAREGSLPPVLLMHMFHQLLYIHLFRPFLKYNPTTLLASTNLEPRKICVQAASTISKFLRFYKREYGLRQICNIAAYIIHSACTIHLLNLPSKTAKRDIVQGLRSLEDMAEGWLCARRALVIVRILAKRWKIELPDEAVVILIRAAKCRAEMFGFQEVVDDEEEDYLQYRGSSLSVSPSDTTEPNQQSPLLSPRFRRGSTNAVGVEATVGGSEDTSSSQRGPIRVIDSQTQTASNQFHSHSQLSTSPDSLRANIYQQPSSNQHHPSGHLLQSETPRRRQSCGNTLPRQLPTINTSFITEQYDHNQFMEVSNPTTGVTPATATSSQAFPTPMITTLSTATAASSVSSEYPPHLSHHRRHSHQQQPQHSYFAAFNTPSPMDSHHSQSSNASSPLPISNLPNMPISITSAISIGYGTGTGASMSVDQWWLRDQSDLVREFAVVEGWLGGSSPGNDEAMGINIGQGDSPSSTGYDGEDNGNFSYRQVF